MSVISEADAAEAAAQFLVETGAGEVSVEPTLHLYRVQDMVDPISAGEGFCEGQAVWIVRYAGIPAHQSGIDEPAASGALETALILIAADTGQALLAEYHAYQP